MKKYYLIFSLGIGFLGIVQKVEASYAGFAFEQLQEDVRQKYLTVQKNLQDPEIQQQIKTTGSFLAVQGIDLLS
jgi:hypothetical protein